MGDDYDVIVVGGGPGGEVAAERCVHAGLSAAVIERELVGGECSFWGCMPSKALLRPGDVLAAARRVPGASQAAAGQLDVQAALARRDDITANWEDKGHAGWLSTHGVDLVRGAARLVEERRLEVEGEDGTRTLTARRAVVLATGSEAVVPPIEGLRDTRSWDNRAATEAHEVPRRLLVLGGGAVGVELAQAWRSLGSDEVTVIEASERLLSTEEPFVGDELRRAFEKQGITVVTGSRMVGARRDGDAVVATLDDGRNLTGDEILVAVGRRGRTSGLGLESIGLDPQGFVDVDDTMKVRGVDGGWLYAIGDVNGRALFTHMSKYHARVAAANITRSNGIVQAEHTAVPRIVFTDPQVAAVGQTERQAREAGIDVGLARCRVGDVAGSTVTGIDVDGAVQLVIDRERDVLVGATLTGPDVGDLVHAATVAIAGQVSLQRLRHSVPSFPSLSEVWQRALENYDGEEAS